MVVVLSSGDIGARVKLNSGKGSVTWETGVKVVGFGSGGGASVSDPATSNRTTGVSPSGRVPDNVQLSTALQAARAAKIRAVAVAKRNGEFHLIIMRDSLFDFEMRGQQKSSDGLWRENYPQFSYFIHRLCTDNSQGFPQVLMGHSYSYRAAQRRLLAFYVATGVPIPILATTTGFIFFLMFFFMHSQDR